LLNPWTLFTLLDICGRLQAPVLGDAYPWAFRLEGLSRLWVGDLATAPAPAAAALYACVATALGCAGFLRLFLGSLRPAAAVRQRLTLAVALPALLLLPVLVVARDTQHPYQFYKLLISVSPLFVVGLAVLFAPPRRGPVYFRLPTAPLVCGVVLAVGAGATALLVLGTTSLEPGARYFRYP